jgi:nitrite reductase/ring-hydroxylating ferredoxin subunit
MNKPEHPRARGRSVQELLDEENVPVPDVLRLDGRVEFENKLIAKDRYYSPEFFKLEVEKVWRKVWQLACFEQDIPNVGDSIVYDIVDHSFIIVREAEDNIRGYYNSCPHRGRQLVTKPCRLKQFTCPYHGLSFELDGKLKAVPSAIAWDFPQFEPGKTALSSVRVETWDGLVFINMDPAAETLAEFLGDLPQHFERWSLKDRWKSVHVAKVVKANWKTTQDAFLDAYHVFGTHPQGLLGGDGSNCQYDVFDGGMANYNRMILAPPMPNPNLDYEVTEQDVIDEMQRLQAVVQYAENEPDRMLLPEGKTAREFLAGLRQAQLQKIGIDTSEMTLIETMSAIQYTVFPNISPWAGQIFYRFRPNGWDPDSSIMETMYLEPWPKDKPKPPAAPIHWLKDDDDWTAAPELGLLASIFNQDEANVPYVQKGLKAGKNPYLSLARYQDNRVRHVHHKLDEYIGRP